MEQFISQFGPLWSRNWNGLTTTLSLHIIDALQADSTHTTAWYCMETSSLCKVR